MQARLILLGIFVAGVAAGVGSLWLVARHPQYAHRS